MSKYMNVSITVYEYPYLKPLCVYYHREDNGKLIREDITLDKARRLMWELKLAGGEKTMRVNIFNPKISYRNVTLMMR